jgi:hypothetical protein
VPENAGKSSSCWLAVIGVVRCSSCRVWGERDWAGAIGRGKLRRRQIRSWRRVKGKLGKLSMADDDAVAGLDCCCFCRCFLLLASCCPGTAKDTQSESSSQTKANVTLKLMASSSSSIIHSKEALSNRNCLSYGLSLSCSL